MYKYTAVPELHVAGQACTTEAGLSRAAAELAPKLLPTRLNTGAELTSALCSPRRVFCAAGARVCVVEVLGFGRPLTIQEVVLLVVFSQARDLSLA